MIPKQLLASNGSLLRRLNMLILQNTRNPWPHVRVSFEREPCAFQIYILIQEFHFLRGLNYSVITKNTANTQNKKIQFSAVIVLEMKSGTDTDHDQRVTLNHDLAQLARSFTESQPARDAML